MKEILLIRHGPTAGNLARRYIGSTDEPLCDWKPTQTLQAQRVFVSPMLRTRQTAQLLFPEQPFTVVEGLRETDFGMFEGKTAQELSGCPEYRKWVDGGCCGAIPGGETVTAFKRRCCQAFLQTVEALPEDTTTAFVIHGGCIMAILEEFARPKRDFYAYHVSNGAVVRCMLEGQILTVCE